MPTARAARARPTSAASGFHRHAGHRTRRARRPARAGPLIIEEYDATCVVPQDWRARLDDRGNIEIEPRSRIEPRRLDPITFEVIKNALSSTADEMALIVMRSAYSPVVRDTMDYSTALCDRAGSSSRKG